MPVVHYLNVKEGDCSIIQHMNQHVTKGQPMVSGLHI